MAEFQGSKNTLDRTTGRKGQQRVDPRDRPVHMAEEAMERQQQMVTLGRLIRERLAPLEGLGEQRELTEALQLLGALQDSLDKHLEELWELQDVVAGTPVAA